MKTNTDILSVLNAISQIANSAKDGALDQAGDPILVGLRREEGNPIVDSRVIDGFSIALHGNCMKVTYNTDLPLQAVHNPKFEDEMVSYIDNIVSFMKKEFKKLTGKELSLSAKGDPVVTVEPVSRLRSSIKTVKHFDVKNLKDIKIDNDREMLPLKDWIGANKQAKAKNHGAEYDKDFDNFDPFKLKTKASKPND